MSASSEAIEFFRATICYAYSGDVCQHSEKPSNVVNSVAVSVKTIKSGMDKSPQIWAKSLMEQVLAKSKHQKQNTLHYLRSIKRRSRYDITFSINEVNDEKIP